MSNKITSLNQYKEQKALEAAADTFANDVIDQTLAMEPSPLETRILANILDEVDVVNYFSGDVEPGESRTKISSKSNDGHHLKQHLLYAASNQIYTIKSKGDNILRLTFDGDYLYDLYLHPSKLNLALQTLSIEQRGNQKINQQNIDAMMPMLNMSMDNQRLAEKLRNPLYTHDNRTVEIILEHVVNLVDNSNKQVLAKAQYERILSSTQHFGYQFEQDPKTKTITIYNEKDSFNLQFADYITNNEDTSFYTKITDSLTKEIEFNQSQKAFLMEQLSATPEVEPESEIKVENKNTSQPFKPKR